MCHSTILRTIRYHEDPWGINDFSAMIQFQGWRDWVPLCSVSCGSHDKIIFQNPFYRKSSLNSKLAPKAFLSVLALACRSGHFYLVCTQRLLKHATVESPEEYWLEHQRQAFSKFWRSKQYQDSQWMDSTNSMKYLAFGAFSGALPRPWNMLDKQRQIEKMLKPSEVFWPGHANTVWTRKTQICFRTPASLGLSD